MKIKKYLYPALAAVGLLIGTQSCQDFERPDFDYPVSGDISDLPEPSTQYNALKMFFPFDGNVKDQASYVFVGKARGGYSYVDGINAKAYKSSTDASYVLLQNHPTIDKMMRDTLTNLGSFTLSVWMNAEKNTAATGFFTIANSKEFWGNMEIFFENNNSDTEAFFKVHIWNERTGTNVEKWVEAKVENVFKRWTHVAFKYDGRTSIFTVYRDGTPVVVRDLEGLGPLKFANMGGVVIGATQFQTTPSLTSGAGKQDWARCFKGELDQFRFYNKALTDAEIQDLYTTKK